MNILKLGLLYVLRWEFIKENKKVREKKEEERKHALDQESDQVNDKGEKKAYRYKNINQFFFQPLSAIC